MLTKSSMGAFAFSCHGVSFILSLAHPFLDHLLAVALPCTSNQCSRAMLHTHLRQDLGCKRHLQSQYSHELA